MIEVLAITDDHGAFGGIIPVSRGPGEEEFLKIIAMISSIMYPMKKG